MPITPSTKVIGLIGHPVAHSLSPQMHNHLYGRLGLDLVYAAFDISHGSVETAVNGMKALGFAGFNVTVPYKETVYRMVDILDREAGIIGAVNTVKIENGCLIGYNTDGAGFVQALDRSGISVRDKNIVMLGAGGAARSIGIYAAKESPRSLYIYNRTYAKAASLADTINEYSQSVIAQAVNNIPDYADIIINTTKLGMWPDIEGNPLSGHILDSRTVVCDIVYNPPETAMLKHAAGYGCTVMNGLGMLIGQGLRAAEIWLGRELPGDCWQIMLEAVNNH